MRDAELECFGADESDLVLKTTAYKCLVCHTGDVVQSPDNKEDNIFMNLTHRTNFKTDTLIPKYCFKYRGDWLRFTTNLTRLLTKLSELTENLH